jgi:hypothetical protein
MIPEGCSRLSQRVAGINERDALCFESVCYRYVQPKGRFVRSFLSLLMFALGFTSEFELQYFSFFYFAPLGSWNSIDDRPQCSRTRSVAIVKARSMVTPITVSSCLSAQSRRARDRHRSQRHNKQQVTVTVVLAIAQRSC